MSPSHLSAALSEFRKRLMTQGQSEGILDPDSAISKYAKTGSFGTTKPLSRGTFRDSSEGSQKLKVINYKSVIQARQEMPLVKVQLDRHKRNQQGDYLSVDTYQEFATAGKVS